MRSRELTVATLTEDPNSAWVTRQTEDILKENVARDWLSPIRNEPEKVESLLMKQVEVTSYAGWMVKSFERRAA